jgi:Ca-activated chloride channel family protein
MNNIPKKTFLLAFTLVPLLVSPASRAQNTPAGPSAPPVASSSDSKPKALKTETDLTLINVSVTDPMDRIVTGLEQENFRIFEDGVEQEVVNFSSQDVPVSIGVIFDMSGSMGDKIQKSRLAAGQFFRTSNPQDEFFLVDFNDRAQLISPFTASVDDLQNRLMFTNAHGLTALLDGIYLGLSQMKGAHNTKKALLIISDGGDNHSRYSEVDVRKYSQEADVQIYAIGLFEPGGGPTPEERGGPELLNNLTEMSGGGEFTVRNLGELPHIATKISMELRNQYVIGYKSGIAITTANGARSRLSSFRRKGFRPSTFSPNPATSPLATERPLFFSPKNLGLLLCLLLLSPVLG